MWCVCVVAGVGWGTPASSACRWPGTSCRVSLSRRCGVGDSVVSSVLDGVCPVAPVGRGWDSIAWGPSLAVAARCVVRVGRGGVAWSGAVCGACGVPVLLRRPFGDEAFLWECAHVLSEGDS
ncbi:hypothetical protein ATANTOWER_015011 [Ataeniobius toweri]|uniref:Secreted protein n=1 Tax=Ataeniobius toweri TaxID=208326 RepID=A0ABU7C8B2_9TELE|nr:hypothetical protein [Ataeniobius toweri]